MPTQQPHEIGQNLWPGNITREMPKPPTHEGQGS